MKNQILRTFLIGIGLAVGIPLVFIGTQVVVKSVNVSNGSEKWNEPNEKPIPSGDIEVEAAQQILFVKCKENSGDLRDEHITTMKTIFKSRGLDYETLSKSERVNKLVDEFIKDGSCDVVGNIDSLQEMVGNPQSYSKIYSRLPSWQKKFAQLMAEGECKLRHNELTVEGRKQHWLDGIEKISSSDIPDLTENEFVEIFSNKDYIQSTLFLTQLKVKSGDCSSLPNA